MKRVYCAPLLFILFEEQYQIHLPYGRAGFQDQEIRASAESYSTDESRNAEVPSGYDRGY